VSNLLEVAHPGLPALLLDPRKWEDVTLAQRSWEQALALPEGSVAYLETPLALQAHPDRAARVDQVVQLLERQGYWHVYDLLPASMPVHWPYTYFPDTWSLALGAYWTASTNRLTRPGWTGWRRKWKSGEGRRSLGQR